MASDTRDKCSSTGHHREVTTRAAPLLSMVPTGRWRHRSTTRRPNSRRPWWRRPNAHRGSAARSDSRPSTARRSASPESSRRSTCRSSSTRASLLHCRAEPWRETSSSPNAGLGRSRLRAAGSVRTCSRTDTCTRHRCRPRTRRSDRCRCSERARSRDDSTISRRTRRAMSQSDANQDRRRLTGRSRRAASPPRTCTACHRRSDHPLARTTSQPGFPRLPARTPTA